jgi:hypothetical protein
MLRWLAGAVAVLVLGLAIVQADEIRGKVKSTDPDKNTITVTVDDKDQTLPVVKDAKIYRLVGKKIKKAQPENVPGGLSGLTSGTDVTLTTEKQDGKEVATQVKVEGLTKKKKKNQ